MYIHTCTCTYIHVHIHVKGEQGGGRGLRGWEKGEQEKVTRGDRKYQIFSHMQSSYLSVCAYEGGRRREKETE